MLSRSLLVTILILLLIAWLVPMESQTRHVLNIAAIILIIVMIVHFLLGYPGLLP